MASIIKVDQIQESTTGVGTNFSTTGSASTPTISIGSQTNKGFYHEGTNKIGVSVGGSKVGEIGVGYGGFTGNIIQVKNFSNSYAHTITNSSNWNNYILSAVATDWEVTITPRYTNSVILVIYNIMMEINGGTNTYSGLKISRKIGSGSYSEIFITSVRQFGWASGSVAGAYVANQWNNNYCDSPNTINTVSYKFPCQVNSGTTSYINGLFGGNISTVLLMEIQQ